MLLMCRRYSLRRTIQLILIIPFMCYVCIYKLDRDELPKVGSSENKKIILYWNNFFNIGPDESKFNSNCPQADCVFTHDKELLNRSSVVLFLADYLNVDLPKHRSSHQHFVFYEMEPPAISDSNGMFYDYKPERYVNFFNRTMTYRLDSDIVLLEPHGRTVKMHSRRRSKMLGNKKTKLVAWIVSNCETTIRREEYVQQLSQFIPVDVYGECGNLTCGDKKTKDCREMLKKDYKFSLSFENSLCEDYVTEKLFVPLYYDTVPVVMGGVNYEMFAPPNSFINVADFASPEKLAEYLLLLDQSEDLYGRYFNWKTDYEVELSPIDGWCDLCRMAHDSSLKPKVYPDIYKWWMGDEHCLTKDYTTLLKEDYVSNT